MTEAYVEKNPEDIKNVETLKRLIIQQIPILEKGLYVRNSICIHFSDYIRTITLFSSGACQ